MQSCQSYQGCPVCLHSWTPGRVLGRKQVVCDGYRCFLHADSAARKKSFTFQGEKYEFRTIERREVPRTRDDSFVRRAVGVASEKKALLRTQDCATSVHVAWVQLVPHECARNNARCVTTLALTQPNHRHNPKIIITLTITQQM